MNGADLDDLMYGYGYAANRFAARATQAWLLGRGLVSEAQDLQSTGETGTIPAPGLFQALRLLGEACTECCNAADRVFTLLRHDLEDDFKLQIDRAMFVAYTRALETEKWTRRIGAICGGISAHLGAADDIERADRAVVVALSSGDEPMQLVDDGLWHVGTTLQELSTELAGDFFRMIIEHDSLLIIESTTGGEPFILRCRFDHAGNLTLTLDNDQEVGLDLEPLIGEGWLEDGGAVAAFWQDPFAIREPVELIKATLEKHLGIQAPDELQFTIRSINPVLPDQLEISGTDIGSTSPINIDGTGEDADWIKQAAKQNSGGDRPTDLRDDDRHEPDSRPRKELFDFQGLLLVLHEAQHSLWFYKERDAQDQWEIERCEELLTLLGAAMPLAGQLADLKGRDQGNGYG